MGRLDGRHNERRAGARVLVWWSAGLLLLALALLTAGCGPDDSPPTGTSITHGSSTAPATSITTKPPTSSSASPGTTAAPVTSTTPSTDALPLGSGREYPRLPVEEKVVALTFDAAYDPAPLGRILDALRAGEATGTFFLTGEFVEDFPAEVRRIHAAGYPIGNHSYDHPDFRELSQEQIASQLGRTAQLLANEGVPDPRPLFRFPFGGRDAATLARIGREGYDSIYWTIDTLDWKPERTPAQIRAVVLEKLRPGAIVLMHVGSAQTAAVLPTLIDDLRERGYGFVTVPEGLALE